MKRVVIIHHGKEPNFKYQNAIYLQITKENTVEKLKAVAKRMMADEVIIDNFGDPVKYYYKLWEALRKALSDDKLGCHANSIIVQLGRSVDSNYEYYNESFDAWLDYFLG